MDWKQIETNWAVMARRIRADAQCGKIDDGTILQHRKCKVEVAESIVAKQIAAVSTEFAQKRNPVSTR
jgi:hypothetical protein